TQFVKRLGHGNLEGLIVGNGVPKTKTKRLEPIQLKPLGNRKRRSAVLQGTVRFTLAAKSITSKELIKRTDRLAHLRVDVVLTPHLNLLSHIRTSRGVTADLRNQGG